MTFFEKLHQKWDQGRFVCVGLDPTAGKLPGVLGHSEGDEASLLEALLVFNKEIVDATHDLVCAFKPNSAFYEDYGSKGVAVLEETFEYMHAVAPDVPIIYDGKRGDIDSTNGGYVRFPFDRLQADACTVPPYMGKESLMPFLEREDKGIFVLCRTSNRGSGEFQNQPVASETYKIMPLYANVASNVRYHWNENGNCGLVAGATYPEELRVIRNIVGDDMPLLIPGVGAQGGDIEETVLAGINSASQGIIVNSSRGIIFASSGEDFADAARQATFTLSKQIVAALPSAE